MFITSGWASTGEIKLLEDGAIPVKVTEDGW
jgi:hypothetical protein